MLAERPLPADLDQRIEGLARAWEADPDLAAVYLFGSRAQGGAAPRSDVDLAVIVRHDMEASARWRKRLDLIGDACVRLGTDAVDVVVLEDTPALLGHRVLARDRLLCQRDPRRRVQVAERVMRQYLDEAHLRAVLVERGRRGSHWLHLAYTSSGWCSGSQATRKSNPRRRRCERT